MNSIRWFVARTEENYVKLSTCAWVDARQNEFSARDPGLSGVEEEITVMFVDMRSWTARASTSPPAEIVEIMNDFFRVSVRAVEEEHRGMG